MYVASKGFKILHEQTNHIVLYNNASIATVKQMQNKTRKGWNPVGDPSFVLLSKGEQLALPSIDSISVSSCSAFPFSITFSNASDMSVARMEPLGNT